MKLLAKARFSRLWIILLFTSLSMISVSAVSSAVSIGQRYQGGIVFYIDPSGAHGLIAAPSDFSQTCTWEEAKAQCDNLEIGGYMGWFLPNKNQLNRLYLQKSVVGGFAGDLYCSSTEDGADLAWSQIFYNGYQYWFIKTDFVRVRAVRAF